MTETASPAPSLGPRLNASSCHRQCWRLQSGLVHLRNTNMSKGGRKQEKLSQTCLCFSPIFTLSAPLIKADGVQLHIFGMFVSVPTLCCPMCRRNMKLNFSLEKHRCSIGEGAFFDQAGSKLRKVQKSEYSAAKSNIPPSSLRDLLDLKPP